MNLILKNGPKVEEKQGKDPPTSRTTFGGDSRKIFSHIKNLIDLIAYVNINLHNDRGLGYSFYCYFEVL